MQLFFFLIGDGQVARAICMITKDYYYADVRIRLYAESLILKGHRVDVICSRDKDESKVELINEVTVHRIPKRRYYGRAKFIYFLEYLSFSLLAFFKLTFLYPKNNYDVIIVATPPVFLVYITFIPKIFGVKVIQDLHDLMPELYMSKYRLAAPSLTVKILKWLEKTSILYSDHVITANDFFKKRLVERGAPDFKITVIINSANPKLFNGNFKWGKSKNSSFLLLNHGTMAERYGLDIAIRAVNLLKEQIPNIRLELVGQGEYKYKISLKKLVLRLGLEKHVHLGGYVNQNDLPRRILSADIGVIPTKRDVHTDLALPTKLFEFIALGTPVVIAKTPSVNALFSDDTVMFFEAENERDMANCILTLYKNPKLSKSLTENAKRAYESYKWETVMEKFLNLIEKI